jgi:hypothetical protein
MDLVGCARENEGRERERDGGHVFDSRAMHDANVTRIRSPRSSSSVFFSPAMNATLYSTQFHNKTIPVSFKEDFPSSRTQYRMNEVL